MSEKQITKPVAIAVGTALAGSFAVAGLANADTGASPFAMTTLAAGYMLGAQEGSCGEGKCGANMKKPADGKCGMKKEAEGKCGGMKKEAEGKCGGMKKETEGKCGGMKKETEGKCGGMKKETEGKCGASK